MEIGMLMAWMESPIGKDMYPNSAFWILYQRGKKESQILRAFFVGKIDLILLDPVFLCPRRNSKSAKVKWLGRAFQVGIHLTPCSKGMVWTQGRYLAIKLGIFHFIRPTVRWTISRSEGCTMDWNVRLFIFGANSTSRESEKKDRYIFTRVSERSSFL